MNVHKSVWPELQLFRNSMKRAGKQFWLHVHHEDSRMGVALSSRSSSGSRLRPSPSSTNMANKTVTKLLSIFTRYRLRMLKTSLSSSTARTWIGMWDCSLLVNVPTGLSMYQPVTACLSMHQHVCQCANPFCNVATYLSICQHLFQCANTTFNVPTHLLGNLQSHFVHICILRHTYRKSMEAFRNTFLAVYHAVFLFDHFHSSTKLTYTHTYHQTWPSSERWWWCHLASDGVTRKKYPCQPAVPNVVSTAKHLHARLATREEFLQQEWEKTPGDDDDDNTYNWGRVSYHLWLLTEKKSDIVTIKRIEQFLFSWPCCHHHPFSADMVMNTVCTVTGTCMYITGCAASTMEGWHSRMRAAPLPLSFYLHFEGDREVGGGYRT